MTFTIRYVSHIEMAYIYISFCVWWRQFRVRTLIEVRTTIVVPPVLGTKVKLNNQVQCSVVTLVVNFELRKEGDLQCQFPIPRSWLSRNLTAEEKQYVKYIDLDTNVKELHYHQLHDSLESQIELVVSQQTLHAVTCHDYIDEEVAQHKRADICKKCHNCSLDEVPKKKLTCPKCKASLTKATLKAMGVDESETQQQQPTTAHRTQKEKSYISNKS